MKSRFALLALIAVVAVPLSAQGGGGRRAAGGGGGGGGGFGGGGGMNVDNLATTYKLTGDQKTKTEALVKTFTDATQKTTAWIQSERQAGGAPNADSAKKVTDARDAFNASFKALLTEPQAAVYDSVQKAQPVVRRRGGGF
jgi:hypothetical protein